MTDRFDTWTKDLARQQDRRGLLKSAAVGGLGLLGLAAVGDGVRAQNKNNNNNNNGNNECTQCKRQCHRNNKKPGKKDPTNCASKCRNQCNRQCNNDGDCGQNQRCQGGECKKQ
jgi:hypothetical protein